MAKTLPQFPTVKQIARAHGLNPHLIEYVIRSNNIRPAAMAGHVRVYDRAKITKIISERERIYNNTKSVGAKIAMQTRIWANTLVYEITG